MTAFNCEKYIAAAIDSIMNQSFADWELIILDDASTDSTYKIISSIPDSRIHYYRNEKNLGYSLNFNKLLKLANADVIAIHDSDDISDSNRLARQYFFMDEYDIVFSGGEPFLDPEKISIHTSVSNNSRNVDFSFNPPVPASTMFKKKLLKNNSGYHEFFKNYTSADRYFYMCLMHENSAKGYYLDENLYFFRKRADSQSRNISSGFEKMYGWYIFSLLREQRISGSKDFLQCNDTIGLNREIEHIRRNKTIQSQILLIPLYAALESKNYSQYIMLLVRTLKVNLVNIRAYRSIPYFIKLLLAERLAFLLGGTR